MGAAGGVLVGESLPEERPGVSDIVRKRLVLRPIDSCGSEDPVLLCYFQERFHLGACVQPSSPDAVGVRETEPCVRDTSLLDPQSDGDWRPTQRRTDGTNSEELCRLATHDLGDWVEVPWCGVWGALCVLNLIRRKRNSGTGEEPPRSLCHFGVVKAQETTSGNMAST